MSEATGSPQIIDQASVHKHEEVFFDEAPHLTEDAASAILAVEGLRPDYLTPHERRELIDPQDRQDIETLFSSTYAVGGEVNYKEANEAKTRLQASENPYVQSVMLFADISQLRYMTDAPDFVNEVKSNPLLSTPVENLELDELTAKTLQELQVTAADYFSSKVDVESQLLNDEDPWKGMGAVSSRLLCSIADQLPTKVVSDTRVVFDALQSADTQELPLLLSVLDRCVRQDDTPTIDTARILGQAANSLIFMRVKRHASVDDIGRHSIQTAQTVVENWCDYESARTGITPNEQQLLLRAYEATEDDFERIHEYKNLISDGQINIPLKTMLSEVIDKPEMIELIEQFDSGDINDVGEVLTAIYMSVRREMAKKDDQSSSKEWSPPVADQMESREERVTREFSRTVKMLMPSLLAASQGEQASNVIKNVSELLNRPGIDVWGVTPEIVSEILTQYPALAQHKDMPQIVDEVYRVLHLEVMINVRDSLIDHSEADKTAAIERVRMKMFENINRIAEVKPELLQIMTSSPFEHTPRYKGVGLLVDIGLKIESVDVGAPLSALALETLLQRANTLNDDQLVYWYKALQYQSKVERRADSLYEKTGSISAIEDWSIRHGSSLDDETFSGLIDLAQSAALDDAELFDVLRNKDRTRTQQVVALFSVDGRRELFELLPPTLKKDVLHDVLHGSVLHGSEHMDQYMKALDIVASEYAEYATIEMVETYAAILIGDFTKAYEYGGIRIKEGGQKGIDQLTGELNKLRDRVLSGEVDIDELESSAIKLGYFKQLVRYASSEWGSHDDGSLLILFKEVEFSREESRTALIDEQAYKQSDELQINKIDQKALDAFEITSDGKAQWKEIVKDAQFAIAVAFERPQLMDGLLTDIDVKVKAHIERLEGGREKLEHRLEQVPEDKQPKLQAKIESLNVEIAELRNTTREALMQSSQIIRHLSVLSKYDDMKSPLRRALFTVTMMKYPNEQHRVYQLMSVSPDKVKLPDLEQMLEFVQHMTNQETWGKVAEAFDLQKGFNRVLEVGAINDNISRGKNIGSTGTRSIQFLPTRDALMELSGHIGDACWANSYHSIARQFPNFTSVMMVQKPGTKDARFIGSALLIEAKDTNGDPILVIRGLNPIQNIIQQLDRQDFFDKFSGYAREIAEKRGMKLAVVIDGHAGGSATNRPALFAHMSEQLKPQLKPIQLAEDPVTEFNGYNIENNTYLL